MQSRRKQRPVYAIGELLNPRMEGVASAGDRHRLNDARIGMGFHDSHQRRQTLAGHQTVGVQDDHVAVLAAPAAAEVRDVAALAFDSVLAPAIVHAPASSKLAAHLRPGPGLGDAQIWIATVAQDEEVEVPQLSRSRERLIGGT